MAKRLPIFGLCPVSNQQICGTLTANLANFDNFVAERSEAERHTRLVLIHQDAGDGEAHSGLCTGKAIGKVFGNAAHTIAHLSLRYG